MNKIVTELKLERAGTNGSSARVCIVTGDVAGLILNAGVGTANRAMAHLLSALGYEVDILFTRVHEGKPFCERGTFADHVEAFRNVGVNLMCIDNAGSWNDWQAVSYAALRHLIRGRYDLAFFDDMDGTAYYSLLARRTGRAELLPTVVCVTTHGAREWHFELNQMPVRTFEDLRLMEMERRSVELADVVKAPSRYILDKYRSYGWAVPQSSFALPNILSSGKVTVGEPRRVKFKELVFFGRLEDRKGLWLFCRALDRLKYKLTDHLVTFLGRSIFEDKRLTAEILLRRSAAWPFPIRLLTNYDRDQAIQYLKGDGRLALILSLEDNCPSTILECLEEGIPFVAFSGSGGEELLDAASREDTLCKPTVAALCKKLEDLLLRGAVTARPAIDNDRLSDMFEQWIRRLLSERRKPSKVAPRAAGSKRSVLLVIVPFEFNLDQAVLELRRAVAAHKGMVQIEVLAGRPAELQELLQASRDPLPIKVTEIGSFAQVAQSLVKRQSTVVGICHISQLLPPSWTDRASRCFAADGTIGALTGMVAEKAAAPADERPPYVSASEEALKFERFLVGYAPALLPLTSQTNAGFALLRSELLAKIAHVVPYDVTYDRLKRMEHWIHELLVSLHLCGERFELVPDLVVEQPVRETPFEVFRLEQPLRALATRMYGYPPGSDPWLLARLAIDVGLERERARAHRQYVGDIGRRISRPLEALPPYSGWEEQVKQLALVAHTGGQIELAIDLCAALMIRRDGQETFSLIEYLDATADAIRLMQPLSVRSYKVLNARGEQDVQILSEQGEIEMRATPASDGPSAILLPLVDLGRINHFISEVRVPDAEACPVRFWIELVSLDRARRWSAAEIVAAGEARRWRVECPPEMREKCSVLLGVEIAEENDAEGNPAPATTVRWIDPRFVRRAQGAQR
jgi:glycosyltransferase involved in cell wall biosynthesis